MSAPSSTTLKYSGLNLNQYGVASPCRTFVLSAASSPGPDLNLIHYISQIVHQTIQGRLKHMISGFQTTP